MNQNYKITISYDGTDYFGWQRQPDKKTIQGLLENCLAQISSKPIPIIGAGRTDAGVHALGQVAHFSADLNLEENELGRAFNGILPHDIRVTSIQKVPDGFHARKSAKSKIYRYRIFNSPVISPFLIRYALHWTSPLNVCRMKEGASLFVREADFTAFSSNRLLHPVRTIYRSEIHKEKEEITYTVEANGFLRYMVRSIVGTLLEVGKEKIGAEEIESLFLKTRRSLSSPTAPARGLCLVEVIY